jgi:hypothetical protein
MLHSRNMDSAPLWCIYDKAADRLVAFLALGPDKEESPDSIERCTSEREDVRKGIGAEKRMTASQSKDEGSPLLQL